MIKSKKEEEINKFVSFMVEVLTKLKTDDEELKKKIWKKNLPKIKNSEFPNSKIIEAIKKVYIALESNIPLGGNKLFILDWLSRYFDSFFYLEKILTELKNDNQKLKESHWQNYLEKNKSGFSESKIIEDMMIEYLEKSLHFEFGQGKVWALNQLELYLQNKN